MRTLLAIALLATTSTYADDFQAVVKQVESHYGKRHLRIPMFLLSPVIFPVTHAVGVSGLKLAVIEGVHASEPVEFNPGPEWRPMIRVNSKHEHTVIYGKDEGASSVRMLLVSLDGGDAVVIQMKMSPSAFLKFIADKSMHT